MKFKSTYHIYIIIILSFQFYLYSEGIDYENSIKSIAHDIKILKTEFPQLIDFNETVNLDLKNLKIEYSFRTHQYDNKLGFGGWTAGVPNPDNDGIWLYIDFHDKNSDRQIHRQPAVMEDKLIGEKQVSFLILQGKDTKIVDDKIDKILFKYGVTTIVRKSLKRLPPSTK